MARPTTSHTVTSIVSRPSRYLQPNITSSHPRFESSAITSTLQRRRTTRAAGVCRITLAGDRLFIISGGCSLNVLTGVAVVTHLWPSQKSCPAQVHRGTTGAHRPLTAAVCQLGGPRLLQDPAAGPHLPRPDDPQRQVRDAQLHKAVGVAQKRDPNARVRTRPTVILCAGAAKRRRQMRHVHASCSQAEMCSEAYSGSL